jgi:hypothetical protein
MDEVENFRCTKAMSRERISTKKIQAYQLTSTRKPVLCGWSFLFSSGISTNGVFFGTKDDQLESRTS